MQSTFVTTTLTVYNFCYDYSDRLLVVYFFLSIDSILSLQTKGTTSFGKRHTKTHTACRRCGKISFHKQKKECSSCGYPQAKIRSCKSQIIAAWRVGDNRGLWIDC